MTGAGKQSYSGLRSSVIPAQAGMTGLEQVGWR
jgi:hypothetical protein